METKENINITPDKSIYPKLGQTGYNVAEALSELIDNSIDARNDRVEIDISVDKKRGIIVVEDNGKGMNKEIAKESIILGKSNKKEGQLGQFGIGLKTACMSLGKKFSIETTIQNSNELYKIVFDEEEFLREGDWSKFEIVTRDDADVKKSGTKIVIDKLRIKFYYNIVDVIKKHLSERFAPFIQNKEAIIKINRELLTPVLLKIIPNTKKEFIINLSDGNKIRGWTGILEIGSMEGSGFNLYRYNRLIRAHEKLGYLYHPSKMWITGDIHLDPVPVTHNKREFMKENPIYIEFFEKFKEILKPLLAEAQQRHKEEKIKDLPQELKETIKDNLLKAFNRVDDYKELAFPDLFKRSKDEGILDDQEKRISKKEDVCNIEDNIVHEDNSIKKGRTPRKTQARKVRFITIAGKKYQFDWEWGKLNEDIAKQSYLDKDRNMIMVILNSQYQMLNIVKPDIFYHAIYVIEGIIEVFLKENGQSLDRVITLRDKTAKQLASVFSDDSDENKIDKDSQVLEAQSYILDNSRVVDIAFTENEKKVLYMRLEDEMSMQDIARSLNLARQRVYQLFDVALLKVNGIKLPRKIKTRRPRESFLEKSISNVLDLKERAKKDKTVEIIERIAENYNAEIKDIFGKSRNKELVMPRHMIMYFLRKEIGLSFPQIGKIMLRDHTSAIHAYKKINRLLQKK